MNPDNTTTQVDLHCVGKGCLIGVIVILSLSLVYTFMQRWGFLQ